MFFVLNCSSCPPLPQTDPNVPTLTPDGTGELSKEAKIAIGVPATIALLVILVIIIIVALRRRTRSSKQVGAGHRVYWLNMSLSIGDYRFSGFYIVT